MPQVTYFLRWWHEGWFLVQRLIQRWFHDALQECLHRMFHTFTGTFTECSIHSDMFHTFHRMYGTFAHFETNWHLSSVLGPNVPDPGSARSSESGKSFWIMWPSTDQCTIHCVKPLLLPLTLPRYYPLYMGKKVNDVVNVGRCMLMASST